MIFDWQSVCLRPAAVEVAFFLYGSLEADARRATEDDLLLRYHASLVAHGVSGYALATFRDDCRRALLHQLAGVVGWLAGTDVETLVGRERALVEAALGDGRLVFALIDHDVASLVSE